MHLHLRILSACEHALVIIVVAADVFRVVVYIFIRYIKFESRSETIKRPLSHSPVLPYSQ